MISSKRSLGSVPFNIAYSTRVFKYIKKAKIVVYETIQVNALQKQDQLCLLDTNDATLQHLSKSSIHHSYVHYQHTLYQKDILLPGVSNQPSKRSENANKIKGIASSEREGGNAHNLSIYPSTTTTCHSY